MKPVTPHPTTNPGLEAANMKTSLQLAAEIDGVIASPWIGLHYKHEFLLHYQHEALDRPINMAHRPKQTH
ncbi:hypothetical protein QFZ60_002384 [Arthrobacter sp. B2I5]|uniref:hypothetical protein n=1 Tax=Arthrobacter sp. B2I5 TaxID=3042266 RepID=UPI0027861C7D|nr:hypothetical protein [Arthrobacter sp. B2I5]MDQ0826211.1 hypothetical protein [Arthrobacter sp. B2I5]